MSDAPPPLGPNEIDDLLRKAQAAAGVSSASSKPAGTESVLAQDELASLLGVATGANPVRPVLADAPEGRMASADVEFLLDQAQQALESVDRPVEADPLEGLAPFRLEEFGGAPPSADVATLELIRDVELDLKIELGRTHMHLEEVLKLHKGSVVPLDKLAGDPVDIFVNGRLIARGEVLVLNDNFCVRVAELITAEAPRIK
jgi:flagellar motor switch protein FliN/FliY